MAARRSARRHAVRVAAVTAAVLTALYVLVAGVLDAVIVVRLTHQVDQRLAAAATTAASSPSPRQAAARLGDQGDLDDAPLIMWAVGPTGRTTLLSEHGPVLPERAWKTSPTEVNIGGSAFRVVSRPTSGGGHLVAGESLAGVAHVRSVLLVVEGLVTPFLAAGVLLLSLVIGLRAVAPVERARRRQLEFTADASHELRTPLSVIEAEVGLALSTPRRASYYRSSLERVSAEGQRLRRIVEDLLWLARFDSEPPRPAGGPLDLWATAQACVERFAARATESNLDLAADRQGVGPALVEVNAQLADRLLGVLVDNALRYTPPGGTVSVTVASDVGRVRVVVEDDGPGLSETDVDRLFDRFHRASHEPGGAGLGLAIADAVVRSSGGRWDIGASAEGGARMEVSWPRVQREATRQSVAEPVSEQIQVGANPAE